MYTPNPNIPAIVNRGLPGSPKPDQQNQLMGISFGLNVVLDAAAMTMPCNQGYPKNIAFHFFVLSFLSGLLRQIVSKSIISTRIIILVFEHNVLHKVPEYWNFTEISHAYAMKPLVKPPAPKSVVNMNAWAAQVASLPAAKGKPPPTGTIHLTRAVDTMRHDNGMVR